MRQITFTLFETREVALDDSIYQLPNEPFRK